MKIEIVKKLDNGDTLIINELCTKETMKDKVELLKKSLVKLTEEFK